VEGKKSLMKPVLLHYYLTNKCNSKCIFCTIWSENPKTDANTQDVLTNLQAARKQGCKFVDFTGGEPLLHQDLPVFLNEAKSLGFITSVTTNCILFPKRAKELAGLIDLLHFSIDSDSEEQHNRIRGVDSYRAVLESIDIAQENKLVPDLLFTYTNENIDFTDGIYELARKNKLMLILDPVFDPWLPDTLTRTTHEKALIISKKPGIYLNKAHLKLRMNGGNKIRTALCHAVDSTIVVLPDNSVALPCYHHRSSFIPLSNNFHTIYSDPKYELAKKNQGKYSFCEGCHINCYFDPSYNYLKNHLTFYSYSSKLKYALNKYFMYGHFPSLVKMFKHSRKKA
jgi:MoaA/NifB/PqqE/SkfB family radical SAM enzyme